jgi:hypothetical protein
MGSEFKLPHSLTAARLEQIQQRIISAPADEKAKAFDESSLFQPVQRRAKVASPHPRGNDWR